MQHSRLLVVDFDFFFHNPMEGRSDPQRGDDLLYDWQHAETPFMQEQIWALRAADFLIAGVPLPRCQGHLEFWDRFAFTTPRPPMFYADSNLHAGRLLPEHYALPGPRWTALHLFDAHHDSGYPQENGPSTYQEWQQAGTYCVEDWMLEHHTRGTDLELTYPAWRPGGDTHPPFVPLATAVDDRTPVDTPFDAVYLCRSAAWVPAWCDEDFTAFLNAFPGRAHPLPGTGWQHPRPDQLPYARILCDLDRRLKERATDRGSTVPRPPLTAPAPFVPPPGEHQNQSPQRNIG